MDKRLHGGDIYTYAKDNKLSPLDFSVNLNPLGMPKGVVKALKEAVGKFSAYPDVNCTALKQALSEYEQVPPDYLVFGNGAADLIYRIVAACQPQKALILAPTFSEYEHALKNSGCIVHYHHLSPEHDFAVQEDLLRQIKGVNMLFLCNPNNPTGSLIAPDMMKRIAETCQTENCWLVIDECFIDFVDEHERYSFKRFLVDFDHTILLKAFTKTFALAGLRLGYCISANRAFINKLEAGAQPWSISVPAQIAGVAALQDKNYLANAKNMITKEKRYLAKALRQLGIVVYDTKTNFMLIKAKENENLYAALYLQGILIRKCDNFIGLNEQYYRISIKKHTENVQLVLSLEFLR